MQHGDDKAVWTPKEAVSIPQMTYAEDQACNLPKIERASVSKPSTTAASPSTTTTSNERIVHG